MSSVIYQEMGQTTNAQIEVICSSVSTGFYLTTDLDLSGRGVKLIGDGSTHNRNKKTYKVTENAFDRIKNEYSTCFMASL